MKYRFDPEALKSRRLAAGMSRELLAVKTGVTKEAVVAWEVGRSSPRAVSLASIAEVLDCNPGDLYAEMPDTWDRQVHAAMVESRTGQGLTVGLREEQVPDAVALLRRSEPVG